MPRLDTAEYLAARNRDIRQMAQIDRRLRHAARLGNEDGAEALNEAYLALYRHRVDLDRAQRRAGR